MQLHFAGYGGTLVCVRACACGCWRWAFKDMAVENSSNGRTGDPSVENLVCELNLSMAPALIEEDIEGVSVQPRVEGVGGLRAHCPLPYHAEELFGSGTMYCPHAMQPTTCW